MNRLTAVLRLDNRQARRAAKQSKKDIKAVGKEAEDTGRVGSASFGQMAVAVTAIGAAAGGAITLINAMKDAAINAARAVTDAAAAEQRRLGGAAGVLGATALRSQGDVTGLTPLQQQQFNLRKAGEFGISPADVGGAVAPIGARPGALAAGLLDPALIFAGGRGIGGGTAGQLAGVGFDIFGARTKPSLEQFLGQVGGAAKISGFTPGQFGDALVRVGALGKQAGLDLPQQLGQIAGFSLFAGGSPRRGSKMIEILQQLRLKKQPGGFLDQLITQAGKDPATADLNDILDGVRKYIVDSEGLPQHAKDARLRELGVKTGLDQLAITNIGRFGEAAFTEKAAEAEAAARGATGIDYSRKIVTDFVATQAGQERRRGFAEQARALEEFPAGGVGEAGFILDQALGRAADFTGFNEELAQFRQTTNAAQATADFGLFGDPTLSEDETKDLFLLNRIFNRVQLRLREIREVGGPSNVEALHHLKEIRRAKRLANTVQGLGATQQEFVVLYKAAIQNAIQFIGRVSRDITFEGRRGPGPGIGFGSTGPIDPSEAEVGVTEGFGFSGIRATHVTIIQNGRGSVENNGIKKPDPQK